MPVEDVKSARTVTRDDVARYAGVSSAVVSYVMNNGPRGVAPATASRVRDAVERLGYTPNLTARALKRGSTQMLGLVLTDWINPFFAELALAIESAAAERQHAIVMTNSAGSPETERQRVGELDARQVDGLLIASLLPIPALSTWAASRSGRGLPRAVLLNSHAAVPGLLTIGPDFVGGCRSATQHLIDHGHRRIALATGSTGGLPVDQRELGWRSALTEAGLKPGPIGRGDYEREGGYRIGQRLLGLARRPTAVVAVSDLIAIGVLRAAHELGARVPEDLAIVSFDGSKETQFSWPPLTTVRQPLEEMAAAAIDLVLADNPGDLVHRLFATTLIVRQSCGCTAA